MSVEEEENVTPVEKIRLGMGRRKRRKINPQIKEYKFNLILIKVNNLAVIYNINRKSNTISSY
jgi:hypothetical protein